jgi:NAD(P)-dependent dehydrogenase (short-subunit alcohol dehydrogenase family)
VLSARIGSISDNRAGGWYSYRASKAALNMIVKTASIELKRKNKAATLIGLHPGTVDTNLSSPFQNMVPKSQLFTAQQSAQKLLKVINEKSREDTGKCFAHDGKEITP